MLRIRRVNRQSIRGGVIVHQSLPSMLTSSRDIRPAWRRTSSRTRPALRRRIRRPRVGVWCARVSRRGRVLLNHKRHIAPSQSHGRDRLTRFTRWGSIAAAVRGSQARCRATERAADSAWVRESEPDRVSCAECQFSASGTSEHMFRLALSLVAGRLQSDERRWRFAGRFPALRRHADPG